MDRARRNNAPIAYEKIDDCVSRAAIPIEGAEVYISGVGWISFDPTNGGVGGFNLIPGGVAQDIRQVMPVVGSFVGDGDAFAGMTVQVLVEAIGSGGAQ